MPGFQGRVCLDRNSFLVPRTEQDFGLHTTSERRSLKTPGLRVRFQFQSILSPAGRWSYSRRPFLSSSGAFSALQLVDLQLAEFDHAGAVLERERPAQMFAVLHVGGFLTVQHDNKMRTLCRDFIEIPFAGGASVSDRPSARLAPRE